MTGDLSNYLTEIIIPDINNPNFVEQFIDFGEAIKENFEKVVSAPYLKGDRGNSIVSFIYQDDSDPQSESSRLKDTIIDLLNETFGESDGGVESDALIYKGQVISGNSAEGIEIDKVLLFRDDAEGKIYISNPYMFIDKRRNSITPEYDNTNLIFTDKSLAITGTGTWNAEEEHYDWSLKGWKVIPALYYDEEIRQYCWLVNGEKTHIIAQGVTGAAGRSARNIRVVSGTINAEHGRLDIGYILNAQNNVIGTSDDEALWIDIHDIEEGDIENGDLVFALANYTESESVFEHALFGQVYVITNEGETSYFIKYNENVDIVRMISSSSFRDDLNDIGEATLGESTQLVAGIRGLYIPEVREPGGYPPERAHMMWSEETRETPGEPTPIGKSKLRIGLVTYDDTSSNRNSANPITPAQAEMSIEYPSTVIKSNVEVSRGTFKDSNNNPVVTGGSLNVEDTITSKDVHTTRNVNVDGIVNVKSTSDSVFYLDKVQAKSGASVGQYKLSLCPSFNIAYKKGNKTLNTVVETVTFPSVCCGMQVTNVWRDVDDNLAYYWSSNDKYAAWWYQLSTNLDIRRAPLCHYNYPNAATGMTPYTDFQLYTNYLFSRRLVMAVNVELAIYFKTRIVDNVYLDDVLVDSRESYNYSHVEIKHLSDSFSGTDSSNISTQIRLSLREWLKIAWLSPENSTSTLTGMPFKLSETVEGGNKYKLSACTAALEILKERSRLLSYYAHGGEYSKDYKLYFDEDVNLQDTSTYKRFIVNPGNGYSTVDASSAGSDSVIQSNGTIIYGQTTTAGRFSTGIYGYDYIYKPDTNNKILLQTGITTSKNTYDYTVNTEKLIFQTPWVGYTKDSDVDTLYAAQQLVDENGNTSITLDVSWPTIANKFYDITAESGKRGIYWPTTLIDGVTVDKRSNIYQVGKTLYRVNDDGTKEPINFLIQVIRVDYGNTFYADVVYKLSDTDSDWSTTSTSDINHLFTSLNLTEGTIAENTSNNSNSSNNSSNSDYYTMIAADMLRQLGKLLSNYQLSNIYKVTSPAFHFILTTSTDNHGIKRPAITDQTITDEDNTLYIAPGLVWLNPNQTIDSDYANYVLAPSNFYDNKSLILRSEQYVDLDLKGDMMQINYAEPDTNSISWSSNIKDKVEKYNLNINGSSTLITIYPRSSMFVNDRPVTIKDSYREHITERYNGAFAGNTNLTLRGNSDYPISYHVSDTDAWISVQDTQRLNAYLGESDYIEFTISRNNTDASPIATITTQDGIDESEVWHRSTYTVSNQTRQIRIRLTRIGYTDKQSNIVITNSKQVPADRTNVIMLVGKPSNTNGGPRITSRFYIADGQGYPSLDTRDLYGATYQQTFAGIVWNENWVNTRDTSYPIEIEYDRNYYSTPTWRVMDSDGRFSRYLNEPTIVEGAGNNNIMKIEAKPYAIPYTSDNNISLAVGFTYNDKSKIECNFYPDPEQGCTEEWQIATGDGLANYDYVDNGGSVEFESRNGWMIAAMKRRLNRSQGSTGFVTQLGNLNVHVYGLNISSNSTHTVDSNLNITVTDPMNTEPQQTTVEIGGNTYIITRQYNDGWSYISFAFPITSNYDKYIIQLAADPAHEPWVEPIIDH